MPIVAPVTVVVATMDRCDELLVDLDRIVASEAAGVVVVDNASTDGTVAAVRAAHPDVVVVPLPANIGAAARTVGARLAATPYVAFADDDSWWDAGALAAAVDVLQADASLALVTGEVRVMPEDDLDPVSAAQAAGRFDVRWQETPVGRRAVAGFLACAAVVDRARFLAAGGFPVELGIGGEEEPLALALATTGWGLAYAPEAVVRHAPSASRDPRARAGRLARNDVLTAVVHHRPRTVAGRGARLVERIARRELAPSVLAATTVGAPWALAARRVASPATLDRFARI